MGLAGSPRQEAMLLTALKFVALLWLGLLVTGIVVLAAFYVFDRAARVIRHKFARWRGVT